MLIFLPASATKFYGQYRKKNVPLCQLMVVLDHPLPLKKRLEEREAAWERL